MALHLPACHRTPCPATGKQDPPAFRSDFHTPTRARSATPAPDQSASALRRACSTADSHSASSTPAGRREWQGAARLGAGWCLGPAMYMCLPLRQLPQAGRAAAWQRTHDGRALCNLAGRLEYRLNGVVGAALAVL